MTTTYIVVADASRARIFTRTGRKLNEVESLVHAEGRLHEGDLVTDKGGDVHESSATASRQAGGEEVATQHHEVIFAREVADRLYRARVDNSMEKLIMVAPPRFLGHLRDKLDAPTAKLVIHSLSKDLTKADCDKITDAVDDLR
ncbi:MULTISPECIES: host attachment protein [Halomonas]|jgi:protein required for attachment to host cells|uniref:Host attachment protein n=3 Tax=Halomonas TaxID=2745 RepID=A0AAU7KI99_9GAMM|nr:MULTISPECIES: host attachment protein [Halomonas]MBR9771494.1 host attachment protein [Gammaproteobacteria bacterium]KJZ08764.1 hypothetical protein TW86_15825 [Halomonas sp. S2151]MAR73183.1 host attachment protein [Halomonas sp.]MBR9880005.1 host attachment protein [Gammaproteobacteria bacterium]MBS8267707.1 host attachment protein [Halomonas litopenaei]|tara:strand:+ start:2226 stop:2657 length:432 start_codon:yes stop_codon:yes gene_type:complete